MKKLIAVIISAIMAFSAASCCFADEPADTTVSENSKKEMKGHRGGIGFGKKAKVIAVDGTSVTLQFTSEPDFEKAERPERPDSENLTDEEKAAIKAERPERPDFENLTDEEKAAIKAERPERKAPPSDSADGSEDSETGNHTAKGDRSKFKEMTFDGETITVDTAGIVKTMAKPEFSENKVPSEAPDIENMLEDAELSLDDIVNVVYDEDGTVKYLLVIRQPEFSAPEAPAAEIQSAE